MADQIEGRFWQWIELDRKALASNVRRFRALAGPKRLLLAVVKANAYGHGIVEISRLALAAGADWLGVHSAEEGLALRAAEVEAPILVLGPVPSGRYEEAIAKRTPVHGVRPEYGRGIVPGGGSVLKPGLAFISRSKPGPTARGCGSRN